MLFYSYVFNLLYKDTSNLSILDLLRYLLSPGVSTLVPNVILASGSKSFGVFNFYMWIKYKISPAVKD